MRIERSDDINAVVRLHNETYAGELGFEEVAPDIATQLAELRRGGWPGEGEGLWIAELDSDVVGCITLRDRGGGLGRLGHLVVSSAHRGHGTGRRLVACVLDAARERGYDRIELETFPELDAAGRIYREVGFELLSAEHRPQWGRVIEWQRYELAL